MEPVFIVDVVVGQPNGKLILRVTMEPNNKNIIPLTAITTLTEMHRAGSQSELVSKVPFTVIAPLFWPDSIGSPQYLYSGTTGSQDMASSYNDCCAWPTRSVPASDRGKVHGVEERQEGEDHFAPDTVHTSEIAGTRILILARGLEQSQIDRVIHSLRPAPI
jgi:hypothetical protein